MEYIFIPENIRVFLKWRRFFRYSIAGIYTQYDGMNPTKNGWLYVVRGCRSPVVCRATEKSICPKTKCKAACPLFTTRQHIQSTIIITTIESSVHDVVHSILWSKQFTTNKIIESIDNEINSESDLRQSFILNNNVSW
jgi:hypothetical protein